MNRKKLERIKRMHEVLIHTKGIKPKKLQALARSLGRKLDNRGKEPNWINPNFRDLRPVSIPDHPGDMNRFTAQNVLHSLEEDIEHWEASLDNN